MKKVFVILSIFLILSFCCLAQDEGAIVKRERITLHKGLYVSGGPSFTLGDNIGDYTSGYNLEIGFHKRSNRILSIGSSFSFISFKYDPNKTQDDFNSAYAGYNNQDDLWQGYIMNLEGGNLNLFSLSFNLKINFVPVRDNSVFSFYAFARPFVTMASLGKITGDVDYYENYNDANNPDDWIYMETLPGEVQSDAELTGGIFVGPGIELNPAKKISVFLQASFGYTFPVTFISTESYDNDLESFFDDKFPLTTKGFPSVNISAGLSYNF